MTYPQTNTSRYKLFTGIRAENYNFAERDHTLRPVIALRAGNKILGFIEYGTTARNLVDQVHDLCDEHDRKLREHQ